MMQTRNKLPDKLPEHQCFRCGIQLPTTMHSGQVTIAGFYSSSQFPYYNTFWLCEECHSRLSIAIKKCLYYTDEEDSYGA